MITPNAHDHQFQFTSHPPERGRPAMSEPACAGAGCCCCSCCLHTLGGVVGALVYSRRETIDRQASAQDTTDGQELNQEELDFQEAFDHGEASSKNQLVAPSEIGMSVTSIYWLCLLLLISCGIILTFLIDKPNNSRTLNNTLTSVLFVLLISCQASKFWQYS